MFFLAILLRFTILTGLQAGSTDTAFLRSGNPGYIVGEPLVAGKLETRDEKYPLYFQIN